MTLFAPLSINEDFKSSMDSVVFLPLMFGCMTQLSRDNGVYHDHSLTTNQFQVYGLGFSIDNNTSIKFVITNT